MRRVISVVVSVALCLSLMGCATIHRHPKLTTFVVATAVGVTVGAKLGYKKPCPSTVSGVAYNGTPPCPSYCDSLGHCDWPGQPVPAHR